ncbi:hypothetical protein CYY_008704 [Polysphondylium violaceum]|uniref:Methionine aminopeptidase n=1 Tax=Polysphondylium violaceum TaxID=133409 RepID=A0A8J4PMN2_9MYCE|nr:hypothetical protein CYY_008704 [Polysphondylium violaceum]
MIASSVNRLIKSSSNVNHVKRLLYSSSKPSSSRLFCTNTNTPSSFTITEELKEKRKQVERVSVNLISKINTSVLANEIPIQQNRKQKRASIGKLNRNPNNAIRPDSVTPVRSVPDHIQPPPYVLGEEIKDIEMDDDIIIHSAESIEGMRKACKIAKQVLDYAGSLVKIGITTDEIDRLVHDEIIRHNAYPSPLLYKGYPKSICTSINEVVCHGIPDNRPLMEGDILNIDITVYYQGYHGDTSATFSVGNIDDAARNLMMTAENALYSGIKQVRNNAPFKNIGNAIQKVIHKEMLATLPEFCGHGIGKDFHTAPLVLHCANNFDFVMKSGMIFTIEPIVLESTEPHGEWAQWSDGWTTVSKEGGWSAQYEHTVLVTDNGCEILTK